MVYLLHKIQSSLYEVDIAEGINSWVGRVRARLVAWIGARAVRIHRADDCDRVYNAGRMVNHPNSAITIVADDEVFPSVENNVSGEAETRLHRRESIASIALLAVTCECRNCLCPSINFENLRLMHVRHENIALSVNGKAVYSPKISDRCLYPFDCGTTMSVTSNRRDYSSDRIHSSHEASYLPDEQASG